MQVFVWEAFHDHSLSINDNWADLHAMCDSYLGWILPIFLNSVHSHLNEKANICRKIPPSQKRKILPRQKRKGSTGGCLCSAALVPSSFLIAISKVPISNQQHQLIENIHRKSSSPTHYYLNSSSNSNVVFPPLPLPCPSDQVPPKPSGQSITINQVQHHRMENIWLV